MAGYIYLIECPHPTAFRVKIGFSSNPHKRLKSLQTGHAEDLQLLGYFEGTWREERELQKTLEAFQTRGEWFTFPRVFGIMLRALAEYRGYGSELLEEVVRLRQELTELRKQIEIP